MTSTKNLSDMLPERGAHLTVNFFDHCVFCLRQLSLAEREEVSKVPSFRNSSGCALISSETFHSLWRIIIPRSRLSDIPTTIKFLKSVNSGGMDNCLEIPPMCDSCGELVEQLGILMEDLLKKAEEIKVISMRSSKFGRHWERHKGFLSVLENSGMEESLIKSTLEFLEVLRRACDDDIEIIRSVKEEPQCNYGTDYSADVQIMPKLSPATSDQEVELDQGDDFLMEQLVHVESTNLTSLIVKSDSSHFEDGAKEHIAENDEYSEVKEEMNEEIESNESTNTEDDTDEEEEFQPPLSNNESSNTEDDSEEEEEFQPPLSDDEDSQSSEDSLPSGLTFPTRGPIGKVVKKVKGKRRRRTFVKMQRCDFCCSILPRSEMMDHMKGHVGDYVCVCPNPSCRKVFPCPAALEGSHLHDTICASFAEKIEGQRGFKKTCETCGFETSSSTAFQKHLQMDHERISKSFQCPVANCEERFSVRQSVQVHIARHTRFIWNRGINYIGQDATKQKCSECAETFHVEEMEDHLKNIHSTMEAIKCKHCPCLFKKREDFLKHLKFHLRQGEVLTCDLCEDETKYLRHAKLLEHYFQAHSIGTKVVCEICNQEFLKTHSLKNHIAKKHGVTLQGPKKKIFQCDICTGVKFATEDAFKHHQIVVHGADPFGCELCGETFTWRSKLLQHEKTHKGILPREFRCHIEGCNKVFANSKSLNYHKISVEHLGRTNAFVCDLCGKGFNRETRLKEHKKRVHSKKTPRPICEECGESFSSKNVLKRHKLIHTGERPFECSICHQRFRQNVTLTAHTRLHKEKGDSFKPSGPMKPFRKRKL